MYPLRRVLKYVLFGTVTVGSVVSLSANQYKIGDTGLVRFGRAAFVAGYVVMHYKRNLYSTKLDPQSDEYANLKSKVHRQAAEKLLTLCCANKGVFIKVGQHIGALDYLLPFEYIETMRVLHSQAPASPLNDVFLVLKQELKQDPLELFTEFSAEPIGTASLAQVHKAKLKDGSVVAVKVQHPAVKGNAFVDMATMEVLVMIASKIFPEFKIKWLVDETKKNIPLELDFSKEASNTKKAKQMFKHFHWLKIPEVYDDLSTDRVLTMEFVEGGQVNDINYMMDNNIDTFEVSDKLGLLYSEMIFRKGYVHSDPHPGNILVKQMPNGRVSIILLDHGLYAHLSDVVRDAYSGLWLSILNKDFVGMKKCSEALGISSIGPMYALFACMVSGRTWNSIQSGITVTKYTSKEKEEFQLNLPKLLRLISETLSLVNKEMLLILKTNDLLRGIEYTLKTQHRMSSFIVMSKCCIQCVYDNKMKQCTGIISKGRTLIVEHWSLLKIMAYYFYLSIRTLSVKSAFKSFLYM